MSVEGDRKLDSRDKKRRGRRTTATAADWASVDHAILLRAICAVSVTGGALRFGYSRDGGAYAIGVYGDGDPYTLWCRPGDAEGVLETLQGLIEDFS